MSEEQGKKCKCVQRIRDLEEQVKQLQDGVERLADKAWSLEWTSATLNQTFRVVGGVRTSADGAFTGFNAVRARDEKPALIALTKKPAEYPYDFVFL